MKQSILILFFGLLLGLKPATENNNEWKLVKNEKGIKAFTREIKNSDIKQVKVTTNIKSKLSALVALVKDVSSHPSWIYRCKSAKIIKETSKKEHYYYNETEAPWPISNRDIVTHAVIKQDKKTKTVTINSNGIPDFIPPKKNIVRIKKLNAQWKFIPKKNETIDIKFFLLIDLGGDLPSWLVNLAIADGPFETVFNMKKEVTKTKYQKCKLDFIEEL